MRAYFLALAAAFCLSLTSCFKDELANAECDILTAWIHIENAEEVFGDAMQSDTIISVNVLSTDDYISFTLYVKQDANIDLTALAPQFTLTPGATISPNSGSVQDFSNGPVTYTTTSEDGKWQRTYHVRFYLNYVNSSTTDSTTTDSTTTVAADTINYDFENFEVSREYYYTWSDLVSNWATGNAGYSMTGEATIYENGVYSTDPNLFPTIPTEGCDGGYGVKMATLSTGTFGTLVNMRLAAGSLYIGTFDTSEALREPLKATGFGEPFTRGKPLKLRGYYKYTRGDSFQDEDGNTVSGKLDEADIYGVFYRNRDESGNLAVLDGDNVKTSERIVGMAQVTNIVETDEWTEFEAEFEYSEEIDQTLLSYGRYSLTIVFSSSVDGAYFRGAIGSTLCIDKVELICDNR